jgi:vacuolar-type H+-ATPase subunit E/Vma4
MRAARKDGEAAGLARRDLARKQAQRALRQAILTAQGEAYEQARSQVRARVRQLRDLPDYPQLQTALAAVVRRELGPEAVVREAPSGGVEGELGGRLIDLSLDTLADRAMDAHADSLSSLWQ